MMTSAFVFWTILGTVAGVGCVLVLVSYLVWRFYIHPKNKVVGPTEDFYEEITETEIKTVTSHPEDGPTVVTRNVRTRTRSSRPRARRDSKDIERNVPQPQDGRRSPTLIGDTSLYVTAWNVPSLMNNWRESEDDFVKLMSKSNFKELPWKSPHSRTARHLGTPQLPGKPDEKMEIIELS